MRRFAFLSFAGIALSAAAANATTIPLAAGFPAVASDSQDQCRLTVNGDGQLFLIAVAGLGGGAPARYRLTNGDMVPIDWRVIAGPDGRFARFYYPFRPGQPGGTVHVSVESEACALTASFTWQRGIRVLE